MAPEHGAEVLSGVPGCSKSVLSPLEKMLVLRELHTPGLSYGAGAMNSTMLRYPQYILNRVPLNRSTPKTR